MAFFFAVVLSTFGLIFVAELPDKTALAALVLATRYPPRGVMLGAGLAFLVQTLVGVAAGGLLSLLPARPIHIAAGLGFLVFAFLALRHKAEEEGATDPALAPSRRPAWLAAFLTIFAAEWGDLTQLATATLAAQTKAPVAVGLGAVLALWAVTALAVCCGAHAGRYLAPALLSRLSAILFAGVGLAMIAGALL